MFSCGKTIHPTLFFKFKYAIDLLFFILRPCFKAFVRVPVLICPPCSNGQNELLNKLPSLLLSVWLFKYNVFFVGWDCVCQEERRLPSLRARFRSCTQKSDIFLLSLIKVTSGSGYLILLANSLSPNTNLTSLLLLLFSFFLSCFSTL